MKTRDNKLLVCGRADGRIDIRKMNDLREIVASFRVYDCSDLEEINTPRVMQLCELTASQDDIIVLPYYIKESDSVRIIEAQRSPS